MGGMNIGKVVVGGLVAGLVYNIGQTIVHLFLFAARSAAFTESLGLPEPDGALIGIFWGLGFLLGLMLVFIYAGFRPRCGAGVGTALAAGGVVFVLAEVVPTLFYTSSGMFGLGEYAPFMISALVILLASSVAGAAVYSEDTAA